MNFDFRLGWTFFNVIKTGVHVGLVPKLIVSLIGIALDKFALQGDNMLPRKFLLQFFYWDIISIFIQDNVNMLDYPLE